jgi:putative transposase
MPRRARLSYADYPLHVVQRGVDRMATFRTPDDYRLYLGLLQELAPLYTCDVHAYVLMTNHVHLLLTPRTDTSCSFLMKHLGQRYVQAVNRRWGRTGHLWGGRFKSCFVDTATYALTCQRYIEMNPVRACMVRHPAEYTWSSFRNNAFGVLSPFLKPLQVYRDLGEDDEARRLAYRGIFDEPETDDFLEEIRAATQSGRGIGCAEFIERLKGLVGPAIAPRKRGPGGGRTNINYGPVPGVTVTA